ncbi:MAG TPA: ATP-binding cassette domain-containing protein [Thermoplasmata archaeon]|nr:ATP-binding cassette domain-containing protein [Thermoplasmata archaeon]HEV2429645.1 ATP-binding cassette domain-containing protein [Thermoplasmata archaeon]
MAEPGSIDAEELVKVYNGTVRAVDGVSFHVKPGEIFGFLGPNGAGKTTSVSMLSAGLRPTSGRAVVDGLEVSRFPEEVKRRIGVIFQESTADGDLTGRENLEIAAGTYGMSRAEGRRRAEALLEKMHLGDSADRYAKTYSGGMRRRLELAVGLVHAPRVLFLDEPTLGLDPQGRAGFWGFIQKLREESGTTVFVTTHYLDEADSLCERIAIIDHGKIVATGTPSELKDRLGGDIVTLAVGSGGPDLTDVVRALPGVASVSKQDGTYRVKCLRGETFVPSAVEAIAKAGVGVNGVRVKRPSLDEVFLEFTGREFREEEGPTATDRAVMLQRVQQGLRGRGR